MANTTNFNWETPDDTDLVKDGAAAIRTLGSAIDTSLVDLKGGTTGQVLSKATNTDMDFTWVAQDDSNAIQNAIIDAKGDLIVGTAADTPARLAVGTNGYVLTADSTETAGLKWAAAAGGGKVLQVIQDTVVGEVTTTSSSMQDTGLDVTITPATTGSKILIMATLGSPGKNNGNVNNSLQLEIVRDGTRIYYGSDTGNFTNTNDYFYATPSTFNYLDSPSTTSAITYKVRFCNYVSGQTVRINTNGSGVSNTITSTLIAMEIGA